MGALDWVIVGAVAAGAVLAIRWIRRHGLGCSGDCAHCGKKDCGDRKGCGRR